MGMGKKFSDQPNEWSAWYSLAAWRGPRGRRTIQLQEEPLCRMCRLQGKRRLAKVADHIERHNGDADKFWNGELQSLCYQHHNATKQAEEHRGFSTAAGLDGWPMDPKHPANR